MFKILSISQIGPGHLYASSPNQDAVGYAKKGGFWAIAVADGLGSKPLSHIGAKLAVDLVLAIFRADPCMVADNRLIENLHNQWVAVLQRRDIEVNSASTTLLCCWGDSKGKFQYIQLGDGLICSTSQIYTPISDVGFSNITTCLSDKFLAEQWYLGRGKLLCKDSLFLMTDGISEDLIDPIEFVSQVHRYIFNKSKRRIKKWLQHELKNWATPHHTDDKTIAMIIKYD